MIGGASGMVKRSVVKPVARSSASMRSAISAMPCCWAATLGWRQRRSSSAWASSLVADAAGAEVPSLWVMRGLLGVMVGVVGMRIVVRGEF